MNSLYKGGLFLEIPLDILTDEKGYYDRQCPNQQCEYIFKIYMEDWLEKVTKEKVFCPMCGHIAPFDECILLNNWKEYRN